jgi:hypothetical protein
MEDFKNAHLCKSCESHPMLQIEYCCLFSNCK